MEHERKLYFRSNSSKIGENLLFQNQQCADHLEKNIYYPLGFLLYHRCTAETNFSLKSSESAVKRVQKLALMMFFN